MWIRIKSEMALKNDCGKYITDNSLSSKGYSIKIEESHFYCFLRFLGKVLKVQEVSRDRYFYPETSDYIPKITVEESWEE